MRGKTKGEKTDFGNIGTQSDPFQDIRDSLDGVTEGTGNKLIYAILSNTRGGQWVSLATHQTY
jgi:hypothetical protein